MNREKKIAKKGSVGSGKSSSNEPFYGIRRMFVSQENAFVSRNIEAQFFRKKEYPVLWG